MAFSHNEIKMHLSEFILKAGFGSFFDGQKLEKSVATAKSALVGWPNTMATITGVSADWKQFSLSVSKLALYDIHFLVDQDPTMKVGRRWDHAKVQIEKTAEIIRPFIISNGILMHSCGALSAATQTLDARSVSDAFNNLTFSNILPVGLALKQKILPIMLENFNVVKRPFIVYILTTGERQDGSEADLSQYVGECKNIIRQSGLPPSVMAIEIIHIGRSYSAKQTLSRLEQAYGPNGFVEVSSETAIEDRYNREQGWNPTIPAVLALRNLVGAIEPLFLEFRTHFNNLDHYFATFAAEKAAADKAAADKAARDKAAADKAAREKAAADKAAADKAARDKAAADKAAADKAARDKAAADKAAREKAAADKAAADKAARDKAAARPVPQDSGRRIWSQTPPNRPPPYIGRWPRPGETGIKYPWDPDF